MDYLAKVEIRRHASWEEFRSAMQRHRIVLLTTRSQISFTAFRFEPDDILMLGRESAGVPDNVHADIKHTVTIPMEKTARSLNVAIAGACVASEALRQLNYFDM